MRMKYFVIYLTLVIGNYSKCTASSCQMNGYILDCSKLNITLNQIQNSLNETNLNDVLELDLSDNNLYSVGKKFFAGLKNLRTLRLSNNRLQYLDGGTFSRLPRLRRLFLDWNNFTFFPIDCLKTTPRLNQINLDNNFITKLDEYSFKYTKKLRNLTLNNNYLQTLDVHTFTGLSYSLLFLSLHGNRLKKVPSKSIRNLHQLKTFIITKNDISYIQKDAFKGMRSLVEVQLFDDIQQNGLVSNTTARDVIVHHQAFRYMSSLRILRLHSYYVKLESFPDLYETDNLELLSVRGIDNLTVPSSFCNNKRFIRSFSVGFCNMSVFPALNKCTSLTTIDFVENRIDIISKDSFSGLPYIENIEILQQLNSVGYIHQDAFSNLPTLVELDLSNFALNQFPNLNGTDSLKDLKLSHCSLTRLPEHLCHNLQNLRHLDLSINRVRFLPSLSKCVSLEFIYLSQNLIESINGKFYDLEELEYLDLSDNHITKLDEGVFRSSTKLYTLNFGRNMLTKIDENAFQNIQGLQYLDVSYNFKLDYLPTVHLQSLREINAKGDKNLIEFPTQEDLPYASRLTLVYPYHCCFFMQKVQQVNHEIYVKSLRYSKWRIIDNTAETGTIPSYLNFSAGEIQSSDEIHGIEPMLKWLNNDTKLIFNRPSEKARITIHDLEDAFCSPTPNAFYPCEDLMGKDWLRFCVWIVFLFALFGNVIVLVVLMVNYNKLDVRRFLIMNLAFADLCLSIYLGFLAFVDLLTLGDFRSHALDWQFSGSCKAAGFLAVFSGELSVFALVVITVERFTTIKNSMHVERRMTTRQTVLIMLGGWIFSFVVAALPLNLVGNIKFSDYTKYSVCLPFETDDITSKTYVMLLLLFNLVAFLVILACYVKIYFYISGSNAWKSGDSRAARRMSVLVFTDFLCWFPIALTALSAIFDQSLLPSLWMSKVLTVFVFPLNACANPFLYAILTKQFRKDIAYLVRHIKDKTANSREVRRSLLRMPLKGSLTYSTSVRRGSSCSFLFNRRCSSKTGDEIRFHTRGSFPQQQLDDEPSSECPERLTSV